MGVYIKGMEMPTSCRACLYSRTDIRNVDWCVLTEKDLPCDCPLVPVPPHGDLIDRDEIPYKKIMLDDDDEFYYGVTQPYIDRMPAVIEAEEGE